MAELYKTGSICSSLAISRQNNRLSSKFIINYKLLFNNYYLLLIINYYLPHTHTHKHAQVRIGGGVSWGLDPLLLARDVGFKTLSQKLAPFPFFVCRPKLDLAPFRNPASASDGHIAFTTHAVTIMMQVK